MTERSAGLLGLAILAALLLFIGWWFGVKSVLWIVGLSTLALLVIGVLSRKSE